MAKMNWLLVVALIAFGANAAPRPETCRNYRNRLDQHVRLMFQLGDRSLVVPKTLEDVEINFCARIASAIEKTKKLVNACLLPFPKQVVGLLVYGIRKENRRICPSLIEKQKAIIHFECIGRNLTPYHDAMELMIDRFEAVRDSDTDKNFVIPYACCYFHEFHKDVANLATLGCPKDIEYLSNMVGAFVEDVLDLNCHTWERNSSKCSKLISEHPITVPTNKTTRAKSFITPMVDLFTNL